MVGWLTVIMMCKVVGTKQNHCFACGCTLSEASAVYPPRFTDMAGKTHRITKCIIKPLDAKH